MDSESSDSHRWRVRKGNSSAARLLSVYPSSGARMSVGISSRTRIHTSEASDQCEAKAVEH